MQTVKANTTNIQSVATDMEGGTPQYTSVTQDRMVNFLNDLEQAKAAPDKYQVTLQNDLQALFGAPPTDAADEAQALIGFLKTNDGASLEQHLETMFGAAGVYDRGDNAKGILLDLHMPVPFP